MGLVGVLSTVAALIYPWVVMFRYLRWRGWRWWLSLPVACLWGALCSAIAMAVMGTYANANIPSFIFGLFIAAGLVYVTWRMRRRYCCCGEGPSAPPPVQPSIPVAQTAPAAPTPDPQPIEAARQQSLAAMRRATDARAKDKAARGEQDAEPLMGYSPVNAMDHYIAEIEFDYEDRRAARSHRHVEVAAVDDEYFEGFCHAASATRTFVIGRVHGKITDMETGELLPPKKWAAQMRRDPRNGIVTMGGEWKHDDDEEGDDLDDDLIATEPEILFTGFPKAQRAELEELAELRGMKVVKSVTKNLAYLCTGPTAGPSKLDQAIEVGAGILTVDGFLELDCE